MTFQRITEDTDAGVGTIRGPFDVEILGELIGYDEDKNVFQFSSLGGVRSLSVDDWEYEPAAIIHKVGWYEDPEHPVSKGYAPVYVDHDDRAFAPGFPKFSDDGTLLHMVATEIRLPSALAALIPLSVEG